MTTPSDADLVLARQWLKRELPWLAEEITNAESVDSSLAALIAQVRQERDEAFMAAATEYKNDGYEVGLRNGMERAAVICDRIAHKYEGDWSSPDFNACMDAARDIRAAAATTPEGK